jgi:hypothetical protein
MVVDITRAPVDQFHLRGAGWQLRLTKRVGNVLPGDLVMIRRNDIDAMGRVYAVNSNTDHFFVEYLSVTDEPRKEAS